MDEPKSMAEIHKIREELTEEWKKKSGLEVLKEREKIKEPVRELGLRLYTPNYLLSQLTTEKIYLTHHKIES